MRTIRLREQGTTSCRLSKTELALLLSARRPDGHRIVSIQVRDAAEGSYDIRAGSVVGTLALPDLQVLIKPKVDLENIFFLLGFRGGLTQWAEHRFPYESEQNFLRILAWAFDAELRRALWHGIAHDYVTREETLVTLRGRIDMGRQIAVNQSRSIPVECRFQEYSVDIPLNQLIKAANQRLRRIPGLEGELGRRINQISSRFSDVSDVEYSPASVPEIAFTRLNRQWEPVAQLASMILRQEALKDETGTVMGAAFTVDMNVLFEKFIEEIVDKEASRVGLNLHPQARVRLTDRIVMRPDLVLEDANRVVAVGDAKYIELDPAEWPHANLYQLLAYCVALGLPRGLLIYASSRSLEHHRIIKADIDLEIVGIDMSGRPEHLVEQARRAAQRLITHAISEKLTKRAGLEQDRVSA